MNIRGKYCSSFEQVLDEHKIKFTSEGTERSADEKVFHLLSIMESSMIIELMQ